MKKKFLIGAILIAIFSISFCNVQAYSGELDTQNYITTPRIINIVNGVGKGTISLSPEAKGYSISYQKVDITQSKFSSIQSKSKELSDYSSSANKTLKEKETNVNNLQIAYENLVSGGTATQEQIATAQTNYNNAYKEYETYINNVNKTMATKRNELNSMIPNYTNSWTKTTTADNNVSIDFGNYSGKVYFALWVKIENGSKTYYDVEIYSSEVKNDSGNSSDGAGSGSSNNGANNNNSTSDNGVSGEWTDFSNANFTLKKDGVSGAVLEVSNITPKQGSMYYIYINNNANKPNITTKTEDIISFTYSEKNKVLEASVEKYVELNQDLYVTVIEYNGVGKENIVTYGKKINRYAEPKYSDAFHATFITDNENQIVTTFTHAEENNRKIQIKIGKITDASILQKIKNQDSSGFASLMDFAKKNNGMYNQTLDANKNSYAVMYDTNIKEKIINLNGLQNGSYYYLYVKADGENGKYISPEAVTLAQSSVIGNKWWLFFYGSSDFKWADFGNVGTGSGNTDNTTAKGNLPKTGISIAMYITFGFALIGGGAFSYRQYRKNNF